MSVEVLTAAVSTQLTSLFDLKSDLGISGASQDAELTVLVDVASAAVESFLGRRVPRQQYREQAAGHGDYCLLLSEFPIDTSVTPIVRIDGTAITDFKIQEAAEGILFRAAKWPSGSTVAFDSDGTPRLEVDYWAGWETIPPTIALAALRTATHLYRIDENGQGLYESVSADGFSEKYRADVLGSQLPPIARSLLSSYRRTW